MGHRAAVISDTDVEYFPGWLSTVSNCLSSGADICAGQQPGWDNERRDNLNPGFVAIRCNKRTQDLYDAMGVTGQGMSELYTFNLYLNTHSPENGGPHWATFHPEVV